MEPKQETLFNDMSITALDQMRDNFEMRKESMDLGGLPEPTNNLD